MQRSLYAAHLAVPEGASQVVRLLRLLQMGRFAGGGV